ncbi:hypothetical protein ABIE21_001853 [Conyzicola nivalis]|uniref:Uncharacterized protein n=1 Tax=Conyzicola nivalis TaxID=1477021 RepID=A0ABV2QP94_9MICO
MTTDDDDHSARLDELRRIGYGRTGSVEEERRAAAARRELEKREGVGDLESAPVDEPVAGEAHPPQTDDIQPSPAVTRSRGWVVPSLAALVVGVFVGAGGLALVSPKAADGDGAAPTRAEGETPVQPVLVPGNLGAAQRLLGSAQADRDRAPADLVDGMQIEAASTRLLQSTESENIWAAKNSDASFCLIVEDLVQGGSGGSCTSSSDFLQYGLQLGLGDNLSVTWDGASVITTTATAR